MKLYKIFFSFLILFLLSGTIQIFITQAQSTEEIEKRISDRSAIIKALEDEIKGYQGQIDTLGKQANTLKKTISELDLSEKKLEASLKLTENKIGSTNSQINELANQIGDKTSRIEDNKRVISQSLSAISKMDSNSLIENLLGSASLAEIWENTESLITLESNVQGRIKTLQSVKVSLEANKKLSEEKKDELLSLESDLTNQRRALVETAKEKSTILSATKNTEANYKKIVKDKEAQKLAFENEIAELESALKIKLDPNQIPPAGTGVLKWPLAKIVITQYFGNTDFANANAQIYKGKGHTGVDFGAPIGTPVKSVMGGVVSGVANTDIIKGCYSYGKWIMVKHPNGLSSLYAHLSVQNVSVGDFVTTGQVIGYSGNTGYSTGPHLHFGLYATQGVQITKLTNSVNCKGATIPLADTKAYLNPLAYL